MKAILITHNQLGLSCLEELVDLGATIQAVYTRERQTDISDQTDLETFTDQAGIPIHHVESVNTETQVSKIKEYNPEFLFVIGWSRLVKQEVLDIPTVAALGMHPAPLPKGRGRAPIAWSVIKGLDETALSFFHLVKEADAGDLVGQQSISIEIDDDASSLYEKVVDAGRTLIREYYPQFESGTVPREPQNDANATWWPKRDPHHGLIDWTRPPQEVYNWIRGQTKPYPGAFSFLEGRKIIIWEANVPDASTAFVTPGEISYTDDGIVGVGAWEGIIELTRVQVGNDDPVAADTLISGYNFEIGDVFENARDQLNSDT